VCAERSGAAGEFRVEFPQLGADLAGVGVVQVVEDAEGVLWRNRRLDVRGRHATTGGPGRYVIAKLDGQDVGAIAGPRLGAAAWSTYVAVDDADAAARRWCLLVPRCDRGRPTRERAARGAVLTDPEGSEFGIWKARRRLGAQVVNQPDAWNFSDLHTADARAAIAFYGEAFGWDLKAGQPMGIPP
jgi:predicted enzyme related to lactoylglutathione lyase